MKHGRAAETISHDDIHAIFKTDAKAVTWLEHVCWVDTEIHCSKCGSYEKIKPRASKNEKRYWCGACLSTFNVKPILLWKHQISSAPMEDEKDG